ncbi:Protein disulfide-isomerase [Monocercomonoides exilis]|uniref:Protein disulfide-isomerase n=1 Tax=Monocercomonoides exilis TaxID=2049356 RepID=UPI00355A996D|nr:Protein disulfide-isomerase [Monocercomonoides exilis]|eukprot:MONOS_5001.1-p1 / transcript=MONOS_5001.1 / gene=MONOS_5001 / organism=Monocercomonoides_exilis_PA203 / gene_product=Protein disulfide-isomerase / transcript_product=Protein disulfide-isomerase / location=Mono_scaffold00140:92749-94426(+) / protein_length=541 / sequence_SO=supercontig / SO=protein_coding / is_pseudo=false
MMFEVFIVFLFFQNSFSLVIPKIHELSKKNYKSFKSELPVAILYHVPGDEDSDSFRKIFQKAMRETARYGMKIGEVDCVENTKICQKANLENLPELRIYLKKIPSVYEGNKTEEGILDWVDEKFLRRVRIFNNREEVDEAISFFEHIIIGYFPSRNCSDFKSFITAGDSPVFGDLWAAVVNSTINKTRIEIFHKIYETVDVYDKNEIEKEKLASWVEEAKQPLFEQLGWGNTKKYGSPDVPVGYYFCKMNYMEPDWLNRQVAKVAHHFKGKMLFVIVDHTENPKLTETMGIAVENMPGFAIEDWYPSPFGKARAHWAHAPNDENPRPSIEADEIIEFCQKYLDGKLQMNLRSEPIPTVQESNVTKVVGDTFKSIVLDETKDVFIRFHANWCDKCKKMAFDYEHLANETASNPNFVVADFDATANDYPPEYIIGSFPSLFLFPAKNKSNPIKCETFNYPERIKKFLLRHIPDLVIDEQPLPERPLDEEEKKKKEEEEKSRKYKEERAEKKAQRREELKQREEDRRLLEEARKAAKEREKEL